MPKRKSNRTSSAAATAKSEDNNDDDNDSNNNNNNNNNEDVAVMWEKLQQTQHKKMKQLEEETHNLQQEKDLMNTAAAAASVTEKDIITINAGGKLITALRSTLTIPTDSMWSFMFSGRWEESLTRDSNGHIFLDYDDELITIIVNFLRMKTVEGPSDPILYPYVNPHKKEEFRRLLRYFGLLEFFDPGPPLLVFSKDNFVHRGSVLAGSTITMTESDNNKKITFVYQITATKCLHRLACSTELDSSGKGSFWKVKIEKFPDKSNGWLLMGIAGNLNVLNGCYSDATTFGWAANECQNSRINLRGTGWPKEEFKQSFAYHQNFDEGEVFYLRLKAKKLSIHRVQEKKTMDMDIIGAETKFYIHFIFGYAGIILSLESLNADERAVFTDHD